MPPQRLRSLDGDGGSGALERLLGLVGRLLVHALENGLGGRVHEVLGLLEAEARERADLLDDLDLDRKSTRLNSSHVAISYAVFCLKKKTNEPPESTHTDRE